MLNLLHQTSCLLPILQFFHRSLPPLYYDSHLQFYHKLSYTGHEIAGKETEGKKLQLIVTFENIYYK